MDADVATYLKELDGINLDNYLSQHTAYNSVVYTHKRCFEEAKPKEKKRKFQETNKTKKARKNKEDKSQQFNSDKDTDYYQYKTYKTGYDSKNSAVEQTIQFAENIVPILLPPRDDKVCYTIRTTKKHKTKDKRAMESKVEHKVSQNNREESNKITETYRKFRKESISVKESFSHSSDNTLDDLNINQSLSCTFSEVSEKKYQKTNNDTNVLNKGQNFAISESFEALANENIAGNAKIKIHLMNERDKNFLSDRIKEPILKAVKECILELHNNNLNTNVDTVQKLMKHDSQKLDNILSKLTRIEDKLDEQQKKIETLATKLDTNEKILDVEERKPNDHQNNLNNYGRNLKTYANKPEQTEAKRLQSSKVLERKPKTQMSTLEVLSEDTIEMREAYSSEEELHQEILERRSRVTLVEELNQGEKNNMECLGGGEVSRSANGTSVVGVKLERPNKIPARCCWTDGGKKN